MIRKNTRERIAKKKNRIRKKVEGTPQRPRLSVYGSLKHVYAQIIDDTTGKTIVAASTRTKSLQDGLKQAKSMMERYKLIGVEAAKMAIEKKITQVVFDRNGKLYHGRIKALADGAREGGLKF
jgi:large subunit ribosomal protein L18